MFAAAIAAAILLGLAWAGAASVRGAAARHLIWTFGVIGAVVMPVAIWLVPALPATAGPRAAFGLPAVIVHPAASVASVPWLHAIWAAGTLVVLARIVRAQLAAHRLIQAAVPVDAEILRSTQIRSPMTVGILRPRILVPGEVTPSVLLHERAHVARRDLLVQLVAQVACALYWWNPLAWLAAARLRIEREHACDDIVLAAGILPSSYASELLAVHAASQAGAACMVDGTRTEARLRRILDGQPRAILRTRFRVGWGALATASVVMLACSAAQPGTVAPVSRVSFGAPSVRGPGPLAEPAMFQAPTTRTRLDLSLVANEVQRRAPALERCYQERLATRPSLAGTVEIHWVIDESGRVVDACIVKDTIGDRAITDCVNGLVLEQGPFPAPVGGAVDVSVPFVFAARS